MKEHARSAGRYLATYERPLRSESILNQKAAIKPHALFVPARVLELWPSCLSDKKPIEVAVEVPETPLRAETLAEALLTAIDRR